MNNLSEALTEISAIRSQIARATEFRGYGPVTVGLTGLLAIASAWVQSLLLPYGSRDVLIYISLWTMTAALAVILIGVEMVVRSRTIHSGMAPEMILCAVEQLVPSGIAGVLIAAVLTRVAPETAWMIPGLWEIVFSLGVFASARYLPRAVIAVAAWYLIAGLICLAWSASTRILSPWAMGLPFAIGQTFAAGVLWWNSPDVPA